MGSKRKNLIGNKYGKLTVVKLLPSIKYGTTKKRRWMSICECGNETESDTGQLTSGKKVSCGCYAKEVSAENGRKSRDSVRKQEASLNVIRNSYKHNAKKRGLNWCLTDDEVNKLFSENCFYCGLAPSNNYKTTYFNKKYSGIDRIDNNIGYTLGNTVPCCKVCNHAKHTMPQDDFIAWIKKASDHLTRIKSEIQQSVKVNGDGVAVDRSMRYRSMDDCPLNAKVLLLTNDGVAVLGKLNAQEAIKLYAGWFPLPKRV